MTAYVALLRAVNVGGSSQVRMQDLQELLTGLGFSRVTTLLQSGNAVFHGPPVDQAQLERSIELGLDRHLGISTQVFVRTQAEWDQLVDANPFPAEARDDPPHLLVIALKSDPSGPDWAALRRAIPGRERVAAGRRQAYVVYTDGIGGSKLTAAVIERCLKTPGTGRNWNTVLKLQARLRG